MRFLSEKTGLFRWNGMRIVARGHCGVNARTGAVDGTGGSGVKKEQRIKFLSLFCALLSKNASSPDWKNGSPCARDEMR